MRLTDPVKWGLMLGVLIFITYLFLHFYYDLFNLPYFWDELGVYSKAAIHMYQNNIGLLPSSLPDELSRGHPVLIPFIFGTSYKIFGCKVVVAKIIAALIYSAGILYIYKIFLLSFSPKYAFIFSFLIFIQPCFLSQSVLVLPEIPLMVAVTIALYYYIAGKYGMTSIALIISLFIKESAVIIPLALYFTDLVTNKFKLKNFIFLIFLPFLAIVLFFAIQYYQRGYVFYPLHTSLVKLEMYYIKERYGDFSKFIFHGQGREFLWFYLPAGFALYRIARNYKTINISNFTLDLKSNRFKISSPMLILFLGGLSFSILNYFLTRYTMYFLIFPYIAFFVLFFRDKWNFINYASIVILVINAVIYNHATTYTDVNFSYVDHIKSCVKAMDYLNTPENSNKTVAMDFPFSVTSWDKNSGYFNKLYFNPSTIGDSGKLKDDYYVFTSPGNIDNLKKYEADLVLLKRIESGYAYVNIYKRKGQ